MKSIISAGLLIVLMLALVLSPIFTGYQPAQAGEGPLEPVVARVYFHNRAELDSLASHLDVWEVQPGQGYLVAMLMPADQARLLASGVTYKIDENKTALLLQHPHLGEINGPLDLTCYRSVENTYAGMQSLAANYPGLVKLIDIGDSWDKINTGGSGGYDLYALVITNQARPGPKPRFFLMAEIHARELTTAETATRLAEYLVSNYGKDADITWLLDYQEIHIVPMTNPDGRKFAEQGLYWRKNTNNTDGCTISQQYGVDLNRNHPFKWNTGGSSGDPCDETYYGRSPGSEPEVQSIQDYVASIFPDQRGPNDSDPVPLTAEGTFITLHSYSELVLWPWGWTPLPAPNQPQLATLGRKLAYFNHYTPQQATSLYVTSGTSDDWAYGELGLAAYTFEMGTEFFQDCAPFESTIYPENLQSLLYAFKSTRRPYQAPAGPDSTQLNVSSITVTVGAPLTLTAVADGTRYSGYSTQNIQAARYSLDDPSWITGTITYPMSARDGNFNAKTETVIGNVDTASFSEGRHTLFVESQDTGGNWGVPSAIFINVVNPHINFAMAPAQAATQLRPGQQAEYGIVVSNTGNMPDQYQVKLDGAAWPTDAPQILPNTLPGGHQVFTVTVMIPEGVPSGASDTVTVTVSSQNDNVVQKSSVLTTQANTAFGVAMAANPYQLSGDPLTWVTYTLHITNTGDSPDVFEISGQGNWPVQIPAATPQVEPGKGVTVQAGVHVPAQAAAYATSTTTIQVKSNGNPTQFATLSLMTTAKPFYSVSVNPSPSEGRGFAGQTLIYTLTVTNTGNISDHYRLEAEYTWPVTPSRTTLALLPGHKDTITISVSIPISQGFNTADSAAFTLVSNTMEPVTATAALKTISDGIPSAAARVNPPGKFGSAGSVLIFSLTVTNTSQAPTTFQIKPHNNTWVIELAETTPLLSPGEADSIQVTVHIPADTPGGASDTAYLDVLIPGFAEPVEQTSLAAHTWWQTWLPVVQNGAG